MKRKIWGSGIVLISVLVLAACSAKKASKEPVAESTATSQPTTASSADSVTGEHSVLKGILKENATLDGEKVSLYMIEVEGVSDPTDLARGIGDEGVILNADIDQIDGEFTEADYQAGQAIEVTLDSKAVMARSMPPQIPGRSIISLTKR